MPRKVYVTDPALFAKPKVKDESKEERAARIAKRQLEVGRDVKTRTDVTYVVDRMLGSGGMGEVYQVHLKNNAELKFAMKTEGNREDAPDKSLLRLKVETFVYKEIARAGRKEIDKTHYVKLVDAGMTNEFKFFIMDLIWQPLHTVIGTMLNWELSAHTKVSIARQTLTGIEGLHTIGFVHRDIKPSNFAVGLPPHEKIVYTLDFGIARAYVDSNDRMKVAREKVIFMGTLPYASIAGLQEKEQGRREDLESWLYMMMEIYNRNNLPWRDMEWDQVPECISLRKNLFKNASIGAVPKLKLPHAYYKIITVIGEMRYYLKRDRHVTGEIDKINRILDSFIKEERIDMNLPLDWEAICVKDVKRKKGKGDKDEKEERKVSKESKKKEKRRKDELNVEVKIPDSGTDRKKKNKQSKSKSASKEKRRHQTQTEDDNSTCSDSDTGGSEVNFKMFKQCRKECKEEYQKMLRDKEKRPKDGMVTAKDEKEKKVEAPSLDDKAVSGPDLVNETRKDKKDKTIDEKAELDEKKERRKGKDKEDTGLKSRFGLPKNVEPIKIDEKTEVDDKKNERTEKMSKTVGEMTEAEEKKNERKKEKEDKGDTNKKSRFGLPANAEAIKIDETEVEEKKNERKKEKGKDKTEADEKMEERKKEGKENDHIKKSRMD